MDEDGGGGGERGDGEAARVRPQLVVSFAAHASACFATLALEFGNVPGSKLGLSDRVTDSNSVRDFIHSGCCVGLVGYDMSLTALFLHLFATHVAQTPKRPPAQGTGRGECGGGKTKINAVLRGKKSVKGAS